MRHAEVPAELDQSQQMPSFHPGFPRWIHGRDDDMSVPAGDGCGVEVTSVFARRD